MDTNNRFSTHTFLISQIFLIIFLAGCSSGGGGGSSSIDCSLEEPPEVCGEDLDGDSLTYAQEVLGWEIAPDRFGLGFGVGGSGSNDAAYNVTSDPNIIDTDADGLDDYQEYINKTDPKLADTDGDGLSDFEELTRWGSSPLSIDSDGDSRGPDGDLAPNSLLFDSAELKIDLVNDPTHTPGAGATSPVTEDTDGDGWTDYYEIVDSMGLGFNPVLADVPITTIEIAASPVIRLLGETAIETNWSREVAVTDSLSQTVSAESAVTRGTEQVIESTIGVGAEFGVETGFEVGTDSKWTGKVSANFSTNLSVSASMASSHSVTWTEGQARTAETTYQESFGEGGSEVVTLNGGYVSLPINLVNTGDISFTLSELRLNVLARYLNGTSEYTPVLELKRLDDISVTLGPAQSYPNILLQSDTNDYELIRSFLKNPSGLLFEISSYTMENADGVSFAFAEEAIKQKTAAVVIDYGGEFPPERYLVATSPHRDPDVAGLPMSLIMDEILGIPYETTAETSGFTSLSKIKTVENDPVLFKKWLVTTTSASMDDPELTGFDDIIMNAGDTIYFMFVKDQDGDGLAAREEFLQGTSDLNSDSDTDGLTDFEEVREGWSVHVEGQLAYDVQSRGYKADSDNDGLNDFDERECGLDPVRTDTDQDKLSDYDEMFGYNIMDDTTLVLKVVPYSGEVILDGGNAVIDTVTPANDDVLVATAPIEAGDIIITAGPDGVLDTVATGDDYLGVNHVAMDCEPAGFATNPLNIDTDSESVPDGVEVQIALGSPNNPNDVAVYVDTDEDGLSDAVESLGFASNVNGINKQFISDPASGDSDGDGLPDLLEYMLKSDPSSDDTDSDGLLDFDEYDFVNQYVSFTDACALEPGCTVPATVGEKHGTNMNHNDTDADGLNDYDDINGWWVAIDAGHPNAVAPYHVIPTSALVKEDSDNDGLFDFEEFTHGADPHKFDTDDDGVWASDKQELDAYSAFSQRSRSPTQKDRKITLGYGGMEYSGKCDWSLTWWDSVNEVEWALGARTTALANNALLILDYSAIDTADPIGIGPIGVADAPANPITPGQFYTPVNFIARFGDTFEFYGYAKEVDKFWGIADTQWNKVDGGLFFHDAACDDCEQLFVKDYKDDSWMASYTEQALRFTVDNTLVSGEHSFTADGVICTNADNLSPVFFPTGPTFTIKPIVTVE